MSATSHEALDAGQAIYTGAVLRVYDVAVHRINGPLLWRCPTRRIRELYDTHASGRHLDIGVGTGLFLDGTRFPVADPAITLMDLNPNSLRAAANRIARYRPTTHRANVLDPWGLEPGSFDSVALCYTLHCVPGTLAEKAVAFDHAREALAPGGVLFGATILGQPVAPYARPTFELFNLRGIFHNRGDRQANLEAALAERFASHHVDRAGSVALFSARVPG